MNEHDEFEDELRQRMRDATNPVVAGEELQRRLVSAATTGSGSASAWTRVFRTTWALPAAAAVVTLLAAGSAVVAVRAAGAPAVTHGTAVGTPTFVPPAPATPTLNVPSSAPPVTAPPTTPSTHATTHSVAPPTTPTPQSTPPSTSAPSTPPPSSPSSVAPPPLPASCTADGGGTAEPQTLAEFTSKIEGSWLACSQPGIFNTGEAGLLIGADGRWAKLVWNSAGQLVHSSAPDSSGTWQASDDTAMNGKPSFSIILEIAGSGTWVSTMPQFAAAITRVNMDNNGYYDTDYVPAS